MMVQLQSRASVTSQGYQIRTRIKTRDFEAQEFASLAASLGPDLSKRLEKRILTPLNADVILNPYITLT
jgi:hypothetical protein